MNHKISIFVVLLLISFSGLAIKRYYNPQQSVHRQIYLLMGQSNMAGRGKLTDEYKALHYNRVMMMNKDLQWVPARHPVHFDKPKVAGVGPGLSFGAALADAYPQDTIYLVPCAVGGTSISKWEPGAFDKSTNTHPYDDALVRIKAAMQKGTVKGAIWLQGESDSRPAATALYLEKLSDLIVRIRKETNQPNLPFVAGELGTYRENYKLINEELAKLPAKVAFTTIVSSEGLKHKGDTTHFDSPSATEYGRRFATGMLKLQQPK